MLRASELKRYSYFQNLSNNCLEEVGRAIETVIVPPGAEIIRQNSHADYLYFVKEGEVEITKRTRHGLDAKITNLKTGEAFGEMALLTCTPRNNKVTAVTETTLLRLNRHDFESVLMMDSGLKLLVENKICEYKSYNDIKVLQPLALLPPEKIGALMEKLVPKKFSSGEVVMNEGDAGDFYYIISDGKASVSKGGHVVDMISTGDGFGEEALIRDNKRNATITAITDLSLLALDKKEFNELLKKSYLDFTFPEDISEADMAKYVFIDARIPPEFEEEHIAGAINIPLENLRQKFNELDPESAYLTYCTNDSRGMAAAFLLASQGFDARNLRGGLSAWTGPLVNERDGIHYPDEEDVMIERLLIKKK